MTFREIEHKSLSMLSKTGLQGSAVLCYNSHIPKWSRRLVVRTPGFHPGNRGFDSHRDHHFLCQQKGDKVGMRTHDWVRPK